MENRKKERNKDRQKGTKTQWQKTRKKVKQIIKE